MALSYTGRFNLQISGTYVNDGAVGNDVTQSVSESISKTITSGVGADMANRYVKKTGTATTTPADVIDCSGTTTDDFGTTTDMSEILCILIKNTGSTNALIVGGEAGDIVNLAADLVVPPDGLAVLYSSNAAGMAVTATTADTISVQTASSTTTYEISVWGRA
jgi:hypothetical protein